VNGVARGGQHAAEGRIKLRAGTTAEVIVASLLFAPLLPRRQFESGQRVLVRVMDDPALGLRSDSPVHFDGKGIVVGPNPVVGQAVLGQVEGGFAELKDEFRRQRHPYDLGGRVSDWCVSRRPPADRLVAGEHGGLARQDEFGLLPDEVLRESAVVGVGFPSAILRLS